MLHRASAHLKNAFKAETFILTSVKYFLADFSQILLSRISNDEVLQVLMVSNQNHGYLKSFLVLLPLIFEINQFLSSSIY